MNFRCLFLVSLATCLALAGNLTGQEAGDTLDKEVAAIFQRRCTMCHDRLGEDSAAGDVGFLLKFERLIEGGAYVDRESPDDSYLLEIVPDEMPKAKMRDIQGNGPLTENELAKFREWVLRGGPSQEYLDLQKTSLRPVISLDDVATAISKDLGGLKGRALKNARFLTLFNLHNNQEIKNDQLDTYRNALTKLLNSLSWQSDLVTPIPIDDQRTIYRFDLGDIGWTAEDWDSIAKHYPYEVVRRGGIAASLYESTSSDLPYLRADWFAFATTQPPLYHDLVGIPEDLEQLEKRLFGRESSREANIRTGRMVRAGFGDSGVSVNNRLIERHAIPFGAYWISYDFGSNIGPANLFDFPLGPKGVFADAALSEFEFKHDGGEVIFNLPNGLQGYGLFDANGKRINVGPTNIVHDDTMAGGAIINGVSCISCHDRGMKPENQKELVALDRIRASSSENFRRFDEDVRIKIAELYPAGKDFAKLIRKDRKRFETALKNAGITHSGEEPVRALFNQFISDLNVNSVASALGISPDALADLMDREGETRQILNRLVDEGVKRQLFLNDFRTIVKLTGLGKTRDFTPLNFPFFGESPLKPQEDVPVGGQQTGVQLIDQDHLQGDLQIALQTAGRRKHYREGESVQCEIVANKDCFVSVFSVDSAGDLTMLVPNRWHPQGLKLTANKKMLFPTIGMGFEFPVQPPHGRTLLKAISTLKPFGLAGVGPDRLQAKGIVSIGNTKDLKRKGVGVQAAGSGRDSSERRQSFDLTLDSPEEVFLPNEWATGRWTITTQPK